MGLGSGELCSGKGRRHGGVCRSLNPGSPPRPQQHRLDRELLWSKEDGENKWEDKGEDKGEMEITGRRLEFAATRSGLLH